MSDNFYDIHIFMCTNQRGADAKRPCCANAGAAALRDYAKKRVTELKIPKARVNVAGCLDRCELGPVLVIYPESVWYRYESESDIDLILEQHVLQKQPVPHLLLQNSQRVINV